MHIRIVNTCNNNCLYCLEQEYRLKNKYLEFNIFKKKVLNSKIINNITFYGGNSFLHPELYNFLLFLNNNRIYNINIISNTYGINENKLLTYKELGLSHLGIYFNTFNSKKHDFIVNGGIKLKELLLNLQIVNKINIPFRIIINISKQNIDDLYKTIYILYKVYGASNFEFINFFPFDRPYDLYKNDLFYIFNEKRNSINKIFYIINKLKINANFLKFDKNFFIDFPEFYDFNNGIVKQIGKEDKIKINNKNPFCFIEKRCNYCFIKDKCKNYEKI